MKQPSLPLSRQSNQKFDLIKPSANEGASEGIPNSPVESSNFHRNTTQLRKESFTSLEFMDRPNEPLILDRQPAQQSSDQPWDAARSFHDQKVDLSKRKITALHSALAGCFEELGKPRFRCRFRLCNQTFSTSGHLTR